MTVVLLGVGAWIAGVGFLCVLGRAAALGDRDMAADLAAHYRRDRLLAEDEPVADEAPRAHEEPLADEEARPERRESVADRRVAGRPWAAGAPGRRRTDVLEDEVAAARRVLREAEANLDQARAQGY